MSVIPKHIYMIGIGGIGMSALAQMLVREGKRVSGSDREESPTTEMLGQQGIEVVIGHDQCNIPSDTELVIYSDAVHVDNPERMRAQELHILEMSYFEALGEVSKSMRTIAVSGTHGKTTTTGMLAKILQAAGKEPTAIVGSIVKDFGSNFLAGRSASATGSGETQPDLFVVEACEYKDHILKLSPEILVITNLELDHTDYFPTLESLKETFRKAVARVPAHGAIVTDPHDPIIADVLGDAQAPVVDYTREQVPALDLIGEFNMQNARAAASAARAGFPDIAQGTIDRALIDFKGSWRRFEYKGETATGALVYDDYAHHPTAIAKTIEAARQKFPGKRIVVAFHPHLYSRTRDFMDNFAKSLAQADEVVLAPIYAAREEPIEGVTSDVLATKISALGTPASSLSSLHDVYSYFTSHHPLVANSLLITMGAGDIYKVAEQIAD